MAVFICSLFVGMGQIEAQETYHTQIYKPKRIKSLQVVQPDQTFTVPVISLGSGEQILINFDDLTPNYERYAYSVIHCDADWKKSSLNELEYMQGFQGLTIDDFANSFNTTMQYTNYQLLLPNDDVQLKVSGNYAVRIYHEDHPEETAWRRQTGRDQDQKAGDGSADVLPTPLELYCPREKYMELWEAMDSSDAW